MAIKVMKVGKSKEEESTIIKDQEELVTESPVNKVASESVAETEDVVEVKKEVKKELKIKCPYCGSGLTITSETDSCSECNEEISSELVSSLFKRSEELARERESSLAESQKVTSAKSFETEDNTDYFKKKDAFSGGKSKTLNLSGTKSPTIIKKSPTIINKKPVTTNKGLVIQASKPKASNNQGVTVKSNYSGNTEKRKTPWLAIVIGGFILLVVGGFAISYYLFVSQFSGILDTVGESTYEDTYNEIYNEAYNDTATDYTYTSPDVSIDIQNVPFATVAGDYYVPNESEIESLKAALSDNTITFNNYNITPLFDPMNSGTIYLEIESGSDLGTRIQAVFSEQAPTVRAQLGQEVVYTLGPIESVVSNQIDFDAVFNFVLSDDPSRILYSEYGGTIITNEFAN